MGCGPCGEKSKEEADEASGSAVAGRLSIDDVEFEEEEGVVDEAPPDVDLHVHSDLELPPEVSVDEQTGSLTMTL